MQIDPFGFYPSYASKIAGLGGPTPAPPTGYVFHSPYIYAEPGSASFTIQFEGLRAGGGRLRLSVHALHERGGRSRRVKRETFDLLELAGSDGKIRLHFSARAAMAYAVKGDFIGDTAPSASLLNVTLDRPAGSARFDRRLHAAKARVFGAPSRAGRSLWSSRSPLDRLGLIDQRPAWLEGAVSQMCTYRQFLEPSFAYWMAALGITPFPHRKLWEFAYILQVLKEQGMLRDSMRGLGFGVGAEATPALLANMGCEIVATDLDAANGAAAGWVAGGQHGDSLKALERPAICPVELFQRKVRYRPVDMNAIPADLVDFDFCWSACAYEHLGSIEAGLRFVKRSMECLKPGGIAVHTSELNLTSNRGTVDHEGTVLFRRRDMERLALELTRLGHTVLPIKFDQGELPPDRFIDMPPYSGDHHLKVALRKFVTTSFGIAVIKR